MREHPNVDYLLPARYLPLVSSELLPRVQRAFKAPRVVSGYRDLLYRW